MYIEYLYWKDHIVEKITQRHGVTPEEVDEVVYEWTPEVRRSSKNRYLLWGQSRAGRYLLIVLEEESKGVFVPLTARGMSEAEKKAFRKRHG